MGAEVFFFLFFNLAASMRSSWVKERPQHLLKPPFSSPRTLLSFPALSLAAAATTRPTHVPRYFGKSVRKSASPLTSHAGGWGSPGSVTSRRGQGLGLRTQKVMKSRACSRGRITRLAWTKPGQRPAVLPVKCPARINRRRAPGVMFLSCCAGGDVVVVVAMLCIV